MYLNRLFFGFIGLILILILVIFLFAGGGKKSNKTTPTPPQPLTSYADTDAQVVMNIRGAVNGDDTHRSIRITIDRNSRQLDVIQGYSNTVIQNNPNYNTEDAYNVFMHAINLGGFTLQRKGTTLDMDSTGQCPLGQVITYQLQQDGNVLSSLWTTSCSLKNGNLGGNSPLLQQLFQAQITNYQTLVQNVNLN